MRRVPLAWERVTDALDAVTRMKFYHKKENRLRTLAEAAYDYNRLCPHEKRWIERQEEHPEIDDAMHRFPQPK
jgi:hypothetical protein